MKNLILIFIILTSVTLFGQTEVIENKTVIDEETNVWMTKISSDSEMRSQMMGMLIDKTKSNKEEMMKLVETIIGNSEMKKMIMETRSQSANNELSLLPKGITDDSVKVMKMESVKPAPKK